MLNTPGRKEGRYLQVWIDLDGDHYQVHNMRSDWTFDEMISEMNWAYETPKRNPRLVCGWFTACNDTAEAVRAHPTIGNVPVCEKHLYWKG